jgi:hypothetical protein
MFPKKSLWRPVTISGMDSFFIIELEILVKDIPYFLQVDTTPSFSASSIRANFSSVLHFFPFVF